MAFDVEKILDADEIGKNLGTSMEKKFKKPKPSIFVEAFVEDCMLIKKGLTFNFPDTK